MCLLWESGVSKKYRQNDRQTSALVVRSCHFNMGHYGSHTGPVNMGPAGLQGGRLAGKQDIVGGDRTALLLLLSPHQPGT